MKAATMTTMPHRVFVSNLPEPYSDDELYGLFSPMGTILDVSVKWTMGFVEYDNADSANKAVRELNKAKVGGGGDDDAAAANKKKQINVMMAASANSLTTVSATLNVTTKSPVCSRLFIGNLDSTLTQADLQRVFEPYGAVAMCEVKKSYGFVRFETLEAAVAARQALNRQRDQNNGKPFRIDFAEPRRKAKLFVGNLSDHQTPEELKEVFSAYGIVIDVSVLSGFGFVHFDDDQDAQKAVDALHGTVVGGNKIKVEVSTYDKEKPVEGSTKDDGCHRCGEVGHFARECPHPYGSAEAYALKLKRERARGGGDSRRGSSPPPSSRGDRGDRGYPPPRYGPGRDPYDARDGYPRPDPYAPRPDPYARDPYGHPHPPPPPSREAVSYPGYGRPPAPAYDLPYDREGRRTDGDRSGARPPPVKRRR